MKRTLLIFLLTLFTFTSYSQSDRKDYFSRNTTMGSLDSEESTVLNERVGIVIIPSKNLIHLTFLETGVIMSLYFYESKTSGNITAYNLNENKWSISACAFSDDGKGSLSLSFLYPKPNNTVIVFGPLQKQ